jgi:hypothetical protein
MASHFHSYLEKAERVVPLLSHIAQIGLFLLTAWGLFYTVIPLYQKAAVDEQVARQQVELERIGKELDASYAKIRRQTVIQFTFFAGPACTGLLQHIPDHVEPGKQSNQKGPLDFDIHACLTQQLQDFGLKRELTDIDRATLAAEVAKVGERLEASRLAANLAVGQLKPADPTKGPVEMGSFSEFALAEMKRLGASPQQLIDAEHKMSLSYQQRLIESRYMDEVRLQLSGLANLTWPAHRS